VKAIAFYVPKKIIIAKVATPQPVTAAYRFVVSENTGGRGCRVNKGFLHFVKKTVEHYRFQWL